MVRYRVIPEIRDAGGSISLGFERKSIDTASYVNLGRLSEQGKRKQVNLGFSRELVVGIFGQRGSGKSYTLGTILEGLGAQDPSANLGYNHEGRGVLLLDTLNIYQYTAIPVSGIPDDATRNTLSSRIEGFNLKEAEISLRTFYPEGHRQGFYTDRFHPFALDTSLLRAEDYVHIFEIDLFKDPTGHLLLAAFDGVKTSGYVTAGEQRQGSEEAGLQELIEYLSESRNTDGTFDPSTVRALLSRLQTLARDRMFASRPTSLSSMIRPNSVTILLLGRLSPSMRSLTASILIRQLFNLRSIASEASKSLKLDMNISKKEQAEAVKVIEESPPRTLLCIDEAQGYVPPSKANPCTEVIIQYVKEGRNHGLSLIMTSQQPSAIHPEVLSQIDCTAAHRLTVQSDIDAVLRSSKGRLPEKISSANQLLTVQDLIRELDRGQAYISHGDTARSFVAEIRPRVTAHGGIEG